MSADDPNDASGAGAHEAELISFPGKMVEGRGTSIEHLAANRSLIVRRALLATAVGGIVPVPVMDDYLAGRVRAGMLMTIADRRRVDLAPSSAELLADPREGSAARNATMTAATLLALKLAWRKVFVLLGAGRRAEEMTTTFQVGTLFDHFCAKLHVGAGLEREATARLRAAILSAIRDSEREAFVHVFKEGGRMLGRSIGEAPAWVTRQLRGAVEQYVASGGNPDAVPRNENRPTAQTGGDDGASDQGAPTDIPGIDPDSRWLDRAAALVENRLGGLGSGYIEALVTRFDAHYQRLSQQGTPPEKKRTARSGSHAGTPLLRWFQHDTAAERVSLKSKTKKPSKGSSGGSKARTGSRTGAARGKTSSARANEPTGRSGKTASGKAAGKRDGKRADKKKSPRPSKAPFGPRSSGRVQPLGAKPAAAPSPRKARETAESLEAATAAIEAALDKKALLPVLIDVSSLASYTDFIGIVSGRSDRQVDAIADGILAAMKSRGRSLLGQEGTGSGRWTLLDFGDVVIHVFYHPVREFYDLESLWVDAPRVQLRIPPEAVMAQPDALYGNL